MNLNIALGDRDWRQVDLYQDEIKKIQMETRFPEPFSPSKQYIALYS